jgi:hypothetical protein
VVGLDLSPRCWLRWAWPSGSGGPWGAELYVAEGERDQPWRRERQAELAELSGLPLELLAGLAPQPDSSSGGVSGPGIEPKHSQTPPVHHQAEGQGQGLAFRRQSLQGQQVGDGIGGVAPLAEPLQPAALRRPQAGDAAIEHRLPQGRRSSRQGRPAARAPAPSSGRSPTCQTWDGAKPKPRSAR